MKRYFYYFENNEVQGFIGENKIEVSKKIKNIINFINEHYCTNFKFIKNNLKTEKDIIHLDRIKQDIILQDWENRYVKLIDLLKKSSFDKISFYINKYYPEECLEDYKKLYFTLLNCEKINNELSINLIIEEDTFFEKEYNVSGKIRGLNNYIGLSLNNLENWLDFYIEENYLKKYELEEFLAHTFIEMTFFGFDNNSINDSKETLLGISEDIEKDIYHKKMSKIIYEV